MWPPSEVIPQHKKRAVALFLVMIAMIIAYTSYLVHQAVERSKNPSTSFVLSSDPFQYPDVYVCLYEFYGCDKMEDEDDCVYSSPTTQGGLTAGTFKPATGNDQPLNITAGETDERGFCVTFYASTIDVEILNPEDYLLFDVFWYPGGRDGASTTCIEEDGAWDAHSESVFIFLRDSETGTYSAGIQVPYSCMTAASTSHLFTFVGIGLTIEDKLDEEETALYQALHSSTSVYKDKRDANITGIVNPYARLSMEVSQLRASLEVITEQNPLEVAAIFGNVGGFWDLLLIFWPFFFVAVIQPSPESKARNFRKSAARAMATIGCSNYIPNERLEDSSRDGGQCEMAVPSEGRDNCRSREGDGDTFHSFGGEFRGDSRDQVTRRAQAGLGNISSTSRVGSGSPANRAGNDSHPSWLGQLGQPSSPPYQSSAANRAHSVHGVTLI